jgi:hypothetical protein
VTVLAVWAVLCAACRDERASAADYRDGCDTSQISWQVRTDSAQVRVLEHRRSFDAPKAGEASEFVKLHSTDDEAIVRLEHPVDRSHVHDELAASVWFASNHPGSVLTMQIRLPDLIDPETRNPVTLEISGQPYTKTGDWEQLRVRASDLAVNQQVMLLRARLANARDGDILDSRQLFIDQVTLVVPVQQGDTELVVDELEFGPLARPDVAPILNQEVAPRPEREECPIRLGPNRVLVENRPFFGRFASYSGEKLDVLRDMGINVALVQRHDNHILADELAQRGIWVMAEPPVPFAVEGEVPHAPQSGLLPIPATTNRILFWNVGTRIPADERRTVERWIDQIRDADRTFDRPRPIIADVKSHERAFSRQVSMLGSSRHILHTSVAPLEYRDYLQHKKNLSLPDRFMFTWIQTEPAAPNVATRHPSRHRPIFVEAEQIWMQAWTAISVGYRAIGFWKTEPLDADTPTAKERRLAISLLNAQIDLLEPFLATGKPVETIPVRVQKSGRSPRPVRGAGLLPVPGRAAPAEPTIHPEIQAAVIQSEYGRLVIPLWYDEGAQFQPGPMLASDVRFLVRGVEQARAWEVTTTSVQPLELERPVPGGLEFRLPMIDQFAFVIMTNREEMEQLMSQRVKTMQQRCAELWVELARARLDRVRPTHEHLQRMARSKVPDGQTLLHSATSQLDQAEVQLQAQQYDQARSHSRAALQLLRRLQRAHWENAVDDFASAASSPHTVCFETLPDHWQMIAAIGRSSGAADDNLLRSGNFEDYDTVKVDWPESSRHVIPRPGEGELRAIELHTEAYEGRYCLRLVSRSAPASRSAHDSSPPLVALASPGIPVQGGQIVVVSGYLSVHDPFTEIADGLLIYDNIKGTVGALRCQDKTATGQWQPFRLIREVARTSDFQLHIELTGDGDVRMDDIRVVALSPVLEAGGLAAQPERPRSRLLDFTPSLPNLRLWPGRKSDAPHQ